MEEPSDTSWQHSFGVLPQQDSPVEEAWVRAVTLEPVEGEALRVSWDVQGDSVRFRWSQGQTERLDLYREGVWRLSIIDQGHSETRLRVDYNEGGLAGVAVAQVWPHFAYSDRLLHVG